MSNKYNFDADLKTYTMDELRDFQNLCWSYPNTIEEEINRRTALPWVWMNEEKIVRNIRESLGKPKVRKGEGWAKPMNILEAYIEPDEVTYNGQEYVANGRGAINIPPEQVDPIQGVPLWVPKKDYDPSHASDNHTMTEQPISAEA